MKFLFVCYFIDIANLMSTPLRTLFLLLKWNRASASTLSRRGAGGGVSSNEGGVTGLNNGRRKYCTKAGPVDVKEVKIPVTWGHIAARHWNTRLISAENRYYVCMDGKIMQPRLTPCFLFSYQNCQIINSIDLPGHGRSSHFPPGIIYSVQDMYVLIRRILKHFEWKKISIISHSMGSQISFSYSGTHPQVVEKLVTIDALSPVVLSKDETIGMVPKLTSDIIKFEEKLATGTRPSYSYDEIVSKLVKTHVGGLDTASCKTLMTRGVAEKPPGSGQYQFTHDIRVHYMPITGISSRQVSFIARNFRSDILNIKATNGVDYTRPYIKNNIENWLSHDENGKEKGNIVRFVDVEGNHHLHLINPVSVLPYIVRFMDDEKDLQSETTSSSPDIQIIFKQNFVLLGIHTKAIT